MNFRKKPVVVQAIQWTGKNQNAVCDFCAELVRLNKTAEEPYLAFLGRSIVNPEENKVLIRTLEGVMSVSAGDWIIRGIQGEFYPCKPDIFAQTYEPATESAEDQDAKEAIERAWDEAFAAYVEGCGADSSHERAQKVLVARLLPMLRVHEFAIERLTKRIKRVHAIGEVFAYPEDWNSAKAGGPPSIDDYRRIDLSTF